MMKILSLKKNFYFLLLFVFSNIFLYLFLGKFNTIFPYNYHNYKFNSHHFLPDKRAEGGSFSLLNALGQYDAQWYLLIAGRGYPENPTSIDIEDKTQMNGLAYAFFPLYPSLVRFVNLFFRNVEFSAFLLSGLFLFLNFFSLYFLISKLDSGKTAFKTIFLLFFFPFSIFYRSYFTEGLYLFLLIWFSYFFRKKKYLGASVFLALINITKMSGFLLNFVFALALFREFRKKNLRLINIISILLIVILPFIFWSLFNYMQSGDFLYFASIRKSWGFVEVSFFPYLLYNLLLFFGFPYLPLHFFHYSLIEMSMILIVLIILIKSKNVIKDELRMVSFALWFSPLLVHDPMSFSRYQIVSFPLFLYLAKVIKGKKFILLFVFFYLYLLITSTLFVNWYWVG